MASSGRLKPGETGTLKARISTLSKSGRVEETVTVRSNDPKRPKVRLKLTADIQEAFNPFAQEGVCTDGAAATPSIVH